MNTRSYGCKVVYAFCKYRYICVLVIEYVEVAADFRVSEYILCLMQYIPTII